MRQSLVQLTIDIPDEFIGALADAVVLRINAKDHSHTADSRKSKWLTHSEAALYIRKSPAALYKLTSNRAVKYRKKGKANIYCKEDLDFYMEAGVINTADEIISELKLQPRKKHLITKT